jgi:putative NIF3 family GTP cyclohydrolase 1 type 2
MSKKTEFKKFIIQADKDIGTPMIVIGDEAAYALEDFQKKDPMEQIAIISGVASKFQQMREEMTVVVLKSLIDGISEEEDDEPEGAIH